MNQTGPAQPQPVIAAPTAFQRTSHMAERMTPVVAKVLPEEKAAFAAATQQVGTTPSNAIRMFIAAFNRCGTFPFDISPTGAFGITPVEVGDTAPQR